MEPNDEKLAAMGERTRAVVCVLLAVCLFGMAGLFYLSGLAVFAWVSILPAALGFLMAYGAIHALLASGTPPTTVRLAVEPVVRGATVKIVIRQVGPALFHSLRASLVCERIERPAGKSRRVTYPVQENFFDSGRLEVARLDAVELDGEFTVPELAEPSQRGVRLTIEWRIEVWGRVAGGADVMRAFPFEVV